MCKKASLHGRDLNYLTLPSPLPLMLPFNEMSSPVGDWRVFLRKVESNLAPVLWNGESTVVATRGDWAPIVTVSDAAKLLVLLLDDINTCKHACVKLATLTC